LVGFPLAVPVPSKQDGYLQGFTHCLTFPALFGGKFPRNSRENHATRNSAFLPQKAELHPADLSTP